eukprot:4058002-Ditylum_brightwellii.AAC.1
MQDNVVHNNKNNGCSQNKQELLLLKVKALYLLEDILLAKYRALIFESNQEVEKFVTHHTPSYVEQWLIIWHSYFQTGIDPATSRATDNIRLITSYFHMKPSQTLRDNNTKFTTHMDSTLDRP